MESSEQRNSSDRDEFDSAFAERMSAAGLTPASCIGIAVSGGPDSTALCILASRWIVQEGGHASNLMGFIVDHDLRAESASEALLVQSRIAALGIRSEVLKCFWPNGGLLQGQMQEAARNARYKLIHEACKRSGVDILLTAHHLDDQIELFIIRLSRHSGLAGLAGMPFVSKLYRFEPDYNGNDIIHAIWLVRPLLALSKHNLYEVCRKHTQPWVEDPTNKNLLFLRNVVRDFLKESSYSTLKKEVPQLIMLCQKLRTFFDKGRDALLLEAASMDQNLFLQNFGYVVLDLKKLKPTEGSKQVLHRTLVAVLQFVAQKERPPRGKVIQTLVDYINSSHLKGGLTLAGCNISLDPGSKGTRLLISASCESKAPTSAQPISIVWACDRKNISKPGPSLQDRMEFLETALCLDNTTLETDLFSRFTKVENSQQFLSKAKQAGMLLDSSALALSKLQNVLSLKPKGISIGNLQNETVEHFDAGSNVQIPCNHACYFMNRFHIAWGERPEQCTRSEKKPSSLQLVEGCKVFTPESSSMQFGKGLLVRYMQEKDWILLFKCTEQNICATDLRSLLDCKEPTSCAMSSTCFTRHSSEDTEKLGSQQNVHILPCCVDGLPKRIQGALVKLKSVPFPVRRGLPVLVTAQGALISIPSLGLNLCTSIWASSRFCPRVPLGGGPASWL